MLSVDVREYLKEDTPEKLKEAIILVAEEVERLGEQIKNMEGFTE